MKKTCKEFKQEMNKSYTNHEQNQKMNYGRRQSKTQQHFGKF